jgi:hypothetical protein
MTQVFGFGVILNKIVRAWCCAPGCCARMRRSRGLGCVGRGDRGRDEPRGPKMSNMAAGLPRSSVTIRTEPTKHEVSKMLKMREMKFRKFDVAPRHRMLHGVACGDAVAMGDESPCSHARASVTNKRRSLVRLTYAASQLNCSANNASFLGVDPPCINADSMFSWK